MFPMCPIADAAKGFLTATLMLKALQMSVLVMKWDLGWVGISAPDREVSKRKCVNSGWMD